MNTDQRNLTSNRFVEKSKNQEKMKVKKAASCDKENVYPSKKVRRALSTDQAEQIIGEIKANASKTFSNVKSTFDNITQKLRRSSRTRPNTWRCQSYDEFENAPPTPVKLYSPFGIVTPSPRRPVSAEKRRRQQTPKTKRRMAFVSPTGKLRQDVEELSSGLRELHTVARALHKRSPNHK